MAHTSALGYISAGLYIGIVTMIVEAGVVWDGDIVHRLKGGVHYCIQFVYTKMIFFGLGLPESF